MSHGFKPAQAYCKRCTELFVYFQYDARRRYCSPCIGLERLDLLAFTKLQRRMAAAASGRRWPFARLPALLADREVTNA